VLQKTDLQSRSVFAFIKEKKAVQVQACTAFGILGI
jgi:hypothetical protein